MSTSQARSSPSSPSNNSPPTPIPSSSIVLLSPTNQVLLLHRLATSSSFASAHVFPGGHLSPEQDGAIPSPDSPDRHSDTPAYRLAGLRETFEESGVLLARRRSDASFLVLSESERERARAAVHANSLRFVDWLAAQHDAAPNAAGLRPFTRWITPVGVPRRFTTQFYLYLLPVAQAGDVLGDGQRRAVIPNPTADGGVEHTEARFDDAAVWLDRAARGEVVLYPSQSYLLSLLGEFLTPAEEGAAADPARHYETQREKLIEFLEKVPTTTREAAEQHHTSRIPWAEKVICPVMMPKRKSQGKIVITFDEPGPELKDSGHGGDWERVMLVGQFGKSGPRNSEMRRREDVVLDDSDSKL